MNSKPMKINQEPGVKGVIRASRPMMIKRTPIVFLTIILYSYRRLPSIKEFSYFLNKNNGNGNRHDNQPFGERE